MQEKKYKIAIVGIGMVGGAILKYFEKKTNYRIYAYDKFKEIGNIKEVNKASFIYICVPTPTTDSGCDTSAIVEIVDQLAGGKVIIIKSTVIPGTTENLQKKYPQHKFIFSPEFLTELTADQDMSFPDRQIVGYTEKSYNVAKDVIQQLPLAPFERIIPATEAEMTKYFNNCWFALKVIYANQMYDVCEKLGLEYETVMDCAAADRRIGRSHLKVWHKDYRGYGGKCIPKDLKAFVKLGDSLGLDLKQLKITDEINEELWKQQPHI